MENKGTIVIYESESGKPDIQITVDNETLWLSQRQIADLFDKDSDTVGLHIKNIFAESELDESATTEFFSVVQQEGGRMVNRRIKYHNLDVILSVGYRVSSKQGTKFRIWANRGLKEHLIQGYSLNQNRLRQYNQNLLELGQLVASLQKTGSTDELRLNEAKGLLDIIAGYTRSFVLLNQFDSSRLETQFLSDEITYEIIYDDARNAIEQLKQELMARQEATELFGKQRDDSFQGILGNVVQSFDGQYLYPTIEEQAANLLYFIIKNHPFADGNKRIGAFLFIWFLEKNQHRFKRSGELKINDNALVALALLVAQSDPASKELMVKLIINLINQS